MSTIAESYMCQAADSLQQASMDSILSERLLAFYSTSVWATPILLIHLFIFIKKIQKGRMYIRNRFLLCANNQCDDPHCLPKLQHRAIRLVELLRRLESKVNTSLFFKILIPLLRVEIDEWEELVDDCTVGSDTEIKNIVHQLAGAL